MYFVYVIKSLSRKRFYIGVTTDVVRRVSEHNKGSAKSTKPFGPWQLVYSEEYNDRASALKREYFLKHSEGRAEKSNIIDTHFVF